MQNLTSLTLVDTNVRLFCKRNVTKCFSKKHSVFHVYVIKKYIAKIFKYSIFKLSVDE